MQNTTEPLPSSPSSPSSPQPRGLIVVPVHNEAVPLGPLLEALPRRVLSLDIDIVVVDDGSTDSSVVIAEQAGASLIRYPGRMGHGYAVQAALAYARKSSYAYVVKLDGDGQHDPKYVSTIFKILLKGDTDLVVSSRYLRAIDAHTVPPFDRRLVNTMFAGVLKQITGATFTDAFCGIFGMTAALLSKIQVKTQDYGVVLELVIRAHAAGARMLEIPHPLLYFAGRGSKFDAVYGTEDHLGQRLDRYARVVIDTLNEVGHPMVDTTHLNPINNIHDITTTSATSR